MLQYGHEHLRIVCLLVYINIFFLWCCRSEVVMVVQAEDHGKRLACEANNGLGSSLHKSFVLNILRKYRDGR